MKFKKKVKKNGATRKRDSTEHDEEEQSQSHSTLETIQSTQKRQKLLQSTLYKRGLDANQTLQADVNVRKPKEEKVMTAQTSIDEKEGAIFKTTFSSTATGEGQSETAMQRKHQSAMEEFISRNMNESQTKEEESREKFSAEADPQQEREADMGAGGTMLGGTGIAEVILPVEQRLETAKNTERLRASLPMAFGKHASSAGSQVQQRDVDGVASSYNFFREDKSQRTGTGTVLHREAGVGKRENEPQQATRTSPDGDRLGFHAARHGLEPVKPERPRHERSRDEIVLKQFMRKERSKR